MKFTKMHGCGNDYIYVNCFDEFIKDPQALSVKLSDRHKGIGADGLVSILPPTSNNADFKMRIFNADGSEAMMCGNAARCIGKYVYDSGLTDKTEFSLETNSGIKKLFLELDPENSKVKNVKVDMGKAILNPKLIPVKSDLDAYINQPIEIEGVVKYVTCVSIGNPHCIRFIDGITPLNDLNLERIGPFYEHNHIFPDRVNTEFVEVVDKENINMRVWERGSGETFACGTGACAAVVAAVLNGYCERGTEIAVHLRGGDLMINYQSDETVFMKGEAVLVFNGEVYNV